MLKSIILASFASALLLLGGCATNSKVLTPEEQAFKSAQQTCTAQTDAMIGGSRYAWGESAQWDNYFVWCMEGKGYTKEQLKKIWY